ncbi:hypothetical protein AMECASPLE_017803 [Ameca splendens]|uniref:Uncharacterized protein n=1 Tax=Ameca splendens TaxID=208324 RepID=A0ABV0ZQ21_9TELE
MQTVSPVIQRGLRINLPHVPDLELSEWFESRIPLASTAISRPQSKFLPASMLLSRALSRDLPASTSSSFSIILQDSFEGSSISTTVLQGSFKDSSAQHQTSCAFTSLQTSFDVAGHQICRL